MERVINHLTAKFGASKKNIEGIIELLKEGNEIPYIARYKRDVTGTDSPELLYSIADEFKKFTELLHRKEFITKKLVEFGVFDKHLESKIKDIKDIKVLNELYDLYIPREEDPVTIAISQGLKPLADAVEANEDVDKAIKEFMETTELSPVEVIEGVKTIIYRDIVSDESKVEKVYEEAKKEVKIKVEVKSDDETLKDVAGEIKDVFNIPSHRMLKINRSKKAKELDFSFEIPEEKIKEQILKDVEEVDSGILGKVKKELTEEAFYDKYRTKAIAKLRKEIIEKAELEAIGTFEINLKNLLMQAPVGQKKILGFDPGVTNGCKLAVIDETGTLLGTDVIYILGHKANKESAFSKMDRLLEKTGFEFIALGNGTAVTESEMFIQEWLGR